MWAERNRDALRFRWQVVQVSNSVFLVRSFVVGEAAWWMLWQVVQARPRPSCGLPVQCDRSPRSWQVRQIALSSVAGRCPGFRILVLSPPDSTWAAPGPWQDSQPAIPSQVVAPVLPFAVAWSAAASSSWHVAHVPGSAYPSTGAGALDGALLS